MTFKFDSHIARPRTPIAPFSCINVLAFHFCSVFSMVWLVTLFFFFVLFCFFFEATSHWLYCGVHPCNDALASVHRHTSLQQSHIGTCLCNETVSASSFLLQSCCLDAFMLHLKDLMRYGSYSLFKISIICIITGTRHIKLEQDPYFIRSLATTNLSIILK